MVKFEYEKLKAERITVNLGGGLQKYAENFLMIVNNAREWKDTFYKVENCHDNRVFVTVSENNAENVAEWLAGLDGAEVKRREKINVFEVFPSYPSSKELEEEDQNGNPIDYELTIYAY